MYVVSVTIFVKPEFIEPFKTQTLDNASHSRKEPGNVRFDVCQADGEPARFLLYEAYHAKEDFARHQTTDHYARWKDAVTPWMAQPRQAVKYYSVFFGDA